MMCGAERGGCICGQIWEGGNGDDGKVVATCHGPHGSAIYHDVPNPEDEEQKANMRLIAAAPELARCLEAILKITCRSCEGGDGRCVTADGFDACLLAREAKAVLAKAKGESQ